MSLLASILDSLFPTRTGTISCPCGAVVCQVNVPGSSYGLMEQTTAHCHCKDCIGFVRACKNGQAVLENNATQMIQFYKSDIKTLLPNDEAIHNKIGRVKVREKVPLIRCYCKDCGTPLGADVEPAPVMLVYKQMIKTGPIHISNLILNYGSAESGTRPYSRRVVVRKGLFAPLFFLRVVTRAILGLIFGKGQGGFLNGNYQNIPVGYENIGCNSSKKGE